MLPECYSKINFHVSVFYSVIGVYIESVKSVQIIFNFHIFLFVLDHTRWNETFKRQNESTHFWDMISMLSFYVTSELSWQLVWRMNPIEMLQSSLSCKINFIVLECFFIIFFLNFVNYLLLHCNKCKFIHKGYKKAQIKWLHNLD